MRLVIDSGEPGCAEASLQAGRLEQAGISVQFDRREPFMHTICRYRWGNLAWLVEYDRQRHLAEQQ